MPRRGNLGRNTSASRANAARRRGESEEDRQVCIFLCYQLKKLLLIKHYS